MDHGNSARVTDQVLTIIAMAEKIVTYVFEECGGVVPGKDGPERLGGSILAVMVSQKTELPQTLCAGVVSAWLADHPTVVSPRGKDGGLKLRADVKAKSAPKEREERFIPDLPGFDSSK